MLKNNLLRKAGVKRQAGCLKKNGGGSMIRTPQLRAVFGRFLLCGVLLRHRAEAGLCGIALKAGSACCRCGKQAV
ncbi:hypothetical protein E4T85_20040 [Bacillus stratosphericus]|nr:hypothetical protein E4T85_20040 [Bacillus stratosphericus]